MILRTRYTPIVAMTMLLASARVWRQEGIAGIAIHDNIGLFNRGPSITLDVDDATDALLALAVDGDLDELGLSYRHNVAVALNRHHRFWPAE